MTKLEMFFQSPSRPAEASVIKPPNASGDGGDGESTEVFDALLKNMSEKPQGAPSQNRPVPFGGSGDQAGDTTSSNSDKSDAVLPLHDAAPDVPIASRIDQQLTLLIQAGLPLQNGTGPIAQTAQEEKAATSRSSLLDMIQVTTEENADPTALQARAAAQMKASVVHQETHFKPVPGGMVQDVARPQGKGAQGQAPSLEVMLGTQTATSGKAAEQTKAPAFTMETLAAAQKGMAEPTSQATVSNEGGNGETGLPMAMLQRIASAVIAESKQAAAQETAQPSQAAHATTHFVAKASEGVVRVLDIQLHPAELGKVTVKMRLSGDTLEMELQASSEATAELLRKDSEKLTGLLRTSGYRPDSVVVVTAAADTQAQDGAAGQRQQPGSQSQAGGFQQGSAHSDGQQRRNAQEFEGGAHREQKSGVDEKIASGTTGDLYL